MTTTETLAVRKLRPADFGRLSTVELPTRKLRAGLSALGIAIGVAAIVAVAWLSSFTSALELMTNDRELAAGLGPSIEILEGPSIKGAQR
jgi:putative ABC transport system permease protein